MLEFDLIGGAVLLRNAEDVVTGTGEPVQGFKKNSRLFAVDLELAFHGFNELHGCILHHTKGGVNLAFLPSPKGRASGAGKVGEIWVRGQKVEIRSPQDAIRHGLGYLTEDRQRTGLDLGLSVTKNATVPSLDDHFEVFSFLCGKSGGWWRNMSKTST